MPEWTGVVVAASDFGIKVVDGGGWLNWSLPEYRGTPFDDVSKGDKVRFEYAEVEKDGKKKTYISVIENLDHPSSVPDNPFPPEEDFLPESGSFGPDSGTVPAAPGAPPEGTIDKDRLIVRQVAIKAASEALAISPLDTEEKAGRITYLAGVLEDWVYRP